MNQLQNYFNNNNGRLIHKWDHYFEIYDKHFSRFKNNEIVILEIGVSQGGSLQMWKDYFGDRAKIYGIDIDPRCKSFEEKNIEIFIGSQSDKKFLKDVIEKIPKLDILIDDGGHSMKQQIVSFELLFDHIKENGVYFCEDCHTSYWWQYGGGFKRSNSFIEYSKNWIDKINAFHSKSRNLIVDKFTQTAKSIHYYDSIVVIEKGKINKPFSSKTGVAGFEYPPNKKITFKNITNRIFGILRIPFYID